jgi:hypothetical protein
MRRRSDGGDQHLTPMRMCWACRNVLCRKCFVSNPRTDRPHRFVRDTELADRAPESVTRGSRCDFRPLLWWNARPFGHGGVPANPRPPSRVEPSRRTQDGDDRQRDHVYLASAIPAASARTYLQVTAGLGLALLLRSSSSSPPSPPLALVNQVCGQRPVGIGSQGRHRGA